MPEETIIKVVARQDLAGAEMTRAMEVTGARIGSGITGLGMKGETVAEITAAAKIPDGITAIIEFGRSWIKIRFVPCSPLFSLSPQVS
jgi:hypothetical protein